MRFVLLLFIFPIAAFSSERIFMIDVFNPTAFPQTNSPVVIPLQSINNLNFDVYSANITLEEKTVTYQLDDLDSDGQNDELCFMCDINSNTHQLYKIVLSDQIQPTLYPIRLYNEMMLDDKKGTHPYITHLESPGTSNLFNDLYHHGVAFESELTGYRIYYDNRQNIDI